MQKHKNDKIKVLIKIPLNNKKIHIPLGQISLKDV